MPVSFCTGARPIHECPLRVIVAAEAIGTQTGGVVTLIAKTLPACVAFGTFSQTDIASYPVTDYLFADPSEKLPVMKPHIARFPNAVLVFRIRFFEKIIGGFRTVMGNL